MSHGWPLVRLGDVLTLQRRWLVPELDRQYVEVGVRSFGRGIFHKAPVTGAELGNKRVLRIEPGDLVLMNVFAWEGAVAVASEAEAGMIGSHRYATYTAGRERCLPEFLNLYFRTEPGLELLRRVSPGSAGRNRTLNLAQFAQQAVPLPSLEEQRRIVSRLDAIAEKVQAALRLRREAATGGAELVERTSESVFAKLARSAETQRFADLHPHVTSGPRNWSARYSTEGMRFYRAQDVGPEDEITHDSKVFVTLPPAGQGRSALLQPGDLMMVITGATVGRVAVFEAAFEPGLVNQHVALCRLPPERVEARFAWWGLRSRSGRQQLLTQRYGQGKPGLNLGNIRSLSIPLPSLEVQRRVVPQLNELQAAADSLVAAQREAEAKLNALVPSVLDREFEGGL